MKKIYILALAMGAISFSSFGQVDFNDDFESYAVGPISPQAPEWRTWSGGNEAVESGLVTTIRANSGAQSMEVGPGIPPDGGPQDQLLLVDAQPDSGIYTAQWSMYIPSGKEGYFNAQGEITTPQTQAIIGGNVYFNRANAAPGVGVIENFVDPDASFNFPHDQWFTLKAEYDMDLLVWDLYIDGSLEVDNYNFNAVPAYLGGFDFFAASEFTLYYIDDVTLATGVLGTDDFSADIFSVYPNPVKDVLNISSKAAIDNVTIYDILGKVVLTANPDAISPSINMSNLASGSYLVKVIIGNASKTVKVIK